RQPASGGDRAEVHQADVALVNRRSMMAAGRRVRRAWTAAAALCLIASALVHTAPVARVDARSAAQAGAARASAIAEGPRVFEQPPPDSRAMMRWWWFGPSVTRDELDREMQRMKEGGLGGFEVATVYPLAVDDPSRGIRNEAYLSPAFLDKIAFASRRAR